MRDLLLRLVDQMVDGGIRLDEGRREFERRFIERALTDAHGHLSDTAERLGIHRNTLARKMAELRIKRPR
jgi:DNA-binding NtrC family response regulator